ncbi:MAG: CoxG family protein [Gammaproteobacteria bacterium]
MSVDRQAVWDALLDEEVLRRCIPGCEELVLLEAESYRARVKAAIGPVKAVFASTLQVTNVNPPESYRLEGEGKAGAVGFGKGFSDVTLIEDNGGTILRYSAQFQVGGRLAQLGSRLVVGATRKIADDFFDRLTQDIDENAEKVASDAPEPAKRSLWLWVAAVVIAVIALGVWLASGAG